MLLSKCSIARTCGHRLGPLVPSPLAFLTIVIRAIHPFVRYQRYLTHILGKTLKPYAFGLDDTLFGWEQIQMKGHANCLTEPHAGISATLSAIVMLLIHAAGARPALLATGHPDIRT